MKPNVDIVSPYIGLNLDSSFNVFPKGSYSYALNGSLFNTDSDAPFLYNEYGNVECWEKPEEYRLVGHCVTETDTFIILIDADTTSIIGEYDPERCKFTEILNDPCLNFDYNHPAKVEFRLLKGCDRFIYITDDYNPVRVINVSDTSSYFDEDGNLDCTRLSYSKAIKSPKITVDEVVDSSGNLKVGTYQFALQYLDVDGNTSSYLGLSSKYNIIYDSYSNDYKFIDGGFNYINDLSETGSVPRANKSIRLKISNLDTRYDAFRLVVILYGAGTGAPSEVYVTESVDILMDTANYTVFTLDNTNWTQITPDDVQNDLLVIEKAKYLTQSDSRLILAGLSYKEYDWGEVQRATQKIIITPVITPIYREDKLFGPKGPFYTERAGYMRDEVYALGIVGTLKNGRSTPVFHIPGRKPLQPDLIPVTIVPDDTPDPTLFQVRLRNVRHLGYDETDIGQTVPRWKVGNTAHSNKMAYWESSVDYPDDLTCNGQRVFPEGKIRHHRFPSSKDYMIMGIENANDPNEVAHVYYVMGFQADISGFLDAMPDEVQEDVIEWRIVRGVRDRFNRTIDDKGIIFPDNAVPVSSQGTEIYYLHFRFYTPGLYGDKSRYFYYFSPKALIKRSSVLGSFIHAELKVNKKFNTNIFTKDILVESTTTEYEYSNESDFYANYALNGYGYIDRIYGYDGLTAGDVGTIYGANYILFGSDRIHNEAIDTHELHLNLTDPFPHKQSTPTDGENTGDYVSLKVGNDAVHSVLHNIDYVDVNKVDDVYYGGDTFIGALSIKSSYISADENEVLALYAEQRTVFGIESEINPELRHDNKNNDPINGLYFPLGNYIDLNGDLEKYHTGPQNEETDGKVVFFPEFYGYNPDYTPSVPAKVYSPLGKYYKYCDNCEEKLPYIYYASEKSAQNEVFDAYRIIRSNNYGFIPGDDGFITAIEEWQNKLFIFAERSLYVQPIRPQSLNTDVSTVYIGSGEIFSIPPIKVLNADYTFGGTPDWRSIIKTEKGLFYSDQVSGRIYAITQSPMDITKGISRWAKENVKLYLPEQLYQLSGVIYDYPGNVGIISGYNPITRSVLFSKRDYLLLDPPRFGGFDGGIKTELDRIYVRESDGLLYIKGYNVDNDKLFHDSFIIEKKGFTISFNLETNSWESFHSYIPDYMMFNSKYLVTTVYNKRGLWIHKDKVRRGHFYNDTRPFIVEMVSASVPVMQKNYLSVIMTADTKRLADDGNSIQYDSEKFFFTDVIAYTRTGSTGNLPIIVDNSLFAVSGDNGIIAKKVENKWRFNYLPNRVTVGETPIFSNKWEDLMFEYPIDKVPNPDAINTVPVSPLNIPRLTGEWLAVRLKFNNKNPGNIIGINFTQFDSNVYNI